MNIDSDKFLGDNIGNLPNLQRGGGNLKKGSIRTMRVHFSIPRWVVIWVIIGLVIGVVVMVNIMFNPRITPQQAKEALMVGCLFWSLVGVAAFLSGGVSWSQVDAPSTMPELNNQQFWSANEGQVHQRWWTKNRTS